MGNILKYKGTFIISGAVNGLNFFSAADILNGWNFEKIITPDEAKESAGYFDTTRKMAEIKTTANNGAENRANLFSDLAPNLKLWNTKN